MPYEHKGQETIPPAWKKVKNQIVDVLNHAELCLEHYRERPSEKTWLDFVNSVITVYTKLRVKIYTARRGNDKENKYKELKNIEAYFLDVGKATLNGTQDIDKAKEWLTYFKLLQDLAEDTGITKVSVEDENPEEAWRENL